MGEGHPTEFPRFKLGCRILKTQLGKVLRSYRASFSFDPSREEAIFRMFERMTGANDLAAIVAGESHSDAFLGLRLIHGLTRAGLVRDTPYSPPAPDALPAAPLPDLSGQTLAVGGGGVLAEGVAERLRTTGARVLAQDMGETGDTITLTCLDRPDLSRLERIQRESREAGLVWLPIVSLGDIVVVGPRVGAATPCFFCFERRWLGLSTAIAFDNAYAASLRGGGHLEESAIGLDAPALLDRIALSAAQTLAASGPCVSLIDRELEWEQTAALLRHPICPACAFPALPALPALPGGPPIDPWSLDATEPSLRELRAELGALAGRPVGLAELMQWVGGHKNVVAAGVRSVVVSRFAVPEPELISAAQDNWAHGAAPSREEAEALAIIEGIERYSGTFPHRADLSAPFREVAGAALLPTELPLFAPAQYAAAGFPFSAFDPEEPIDWTWAHDFTRGRPLLVPSSAVWYGRASALLAESSSGIAAHSSRKKALVSGVLELIERDAFMLHWLHRISPPLADLDALADSTSRALLSALAQSGYLVRLADLTTDLDLPVYLAIATCEDRQRPAFLIGAGADLEPERAAARAVSELYSGSLSAGELWTLGAPMKDSEVLRIEDHRKAYEHPDWLPRTAFLWSSSRRVELNARGSLGGDPLEALIAALARRGHSVLGLDITPPDVATTRIRVVRALVPGLVPLSFSPGPRLGGRRLWEAPPRMGVTGAAREEDLNLTPHCFP